MSLGPQRGQRRHAEREFHRGRIGSSGCSRAFNPSRTCYLGLASEMRDEYTDAIAAEHRRMDRHDDYSAGFRTQSASRDVSPAGASGGGGGGRAVPRRASSAPRRDGVPTGVVDSDVSHGGGDVRGSPAAGPTAEHRRGGPASRSPAAGATDSTSRGRGRPFDADFGGINPSSRCGVREYAGGESVPAATYHAPQPAQASPEARGGGPAGGRGAAVEMAHKALHRVEDQLLRLSSAAATAGGGRTASSSPTRDPVPRRDASPPAAPSPRRHVVGSRNHSCDRCDRLERAANAPSPHDVVGADLPPGCVTYAQLEGVVLPLRDALREVTDAVAEHDDCLCTMAASADPDVGNPGTRAAIERIVVRQLARMSASGKLSAYVSVGMEAASSGGRGLSPGAMSGESESPYVSPSASSTNLRTLRKALRREICDERESRRSDVDTLHAALEDAMSRLRGMEASVASLEAHRGRPDGAAAASHYESVSSTATTSMRRLHPDDVVLVQRLVSEAEPAMVSRAEASVQPAIQHAKAIAVACQQASETAAAKTSAAIAADVTQLRDSVRRHARDIEDKLSVLRTDAQKAVGDLARACSVACPVV